MSEYKNRVLKEFANTLKESGVTSIVLAFLDSRFAWEFGRFDEAELEELEKIFHTMEYEKPQTRTIFTFPPEAKKEESSVAEVSGEEKKSQVKEVKESKEIVYEDYDKSVKVVSERVDRNSTIHQVVIVNCSRCGGAGGSERWSYTGRTCFKCGGTGKQEGKRKIYTLEHRAKLDAQREKRNLKKEAEIREQAGEKNKVWLENMGYGQEKIHLVIGNSYHIKDELKEAGARYSGQFGNWYFSEKPEQWDTAELEVKELIQYDMYGQVDKKINSDVSDYVQAQIKKYSKPEKESQYVGEVGTRMDLELTVVGSFDIETAFGWNCINSLVDDAGNKFIWKTQQDLAYTHGEGVKIKLKGTVKEHSEYREQRQTVLTRCKVKD